MQQQPKVPVIKRLVLRQFETLLECCVGCYLLASICVSLTAQSLTMSPVPQSLPFQVQCFVPRGTLAASAVCYPPALYPCLQMGGPL